MGMFYNISDFKHENIRHVIILSCIFLLSFIFLTVGLFWFLPHHGVDVWSAVMVAPVIFGVLTYVVLGLSLSFLSYKCFSRVLCFMAVISDRRHSYLVNDFLINVFILNVFASSLIIGYVMTYFIGAHVHISHVIYVLQLSLIFPITYCMRILEGCIDKIINQCNAVERTCVNIINQVQKL